MGRKQKITRNTAVCRELYKGRSIGEVASEFGITRQRIEAISKKYFNNYVKNFIKSN